MRLQNKKDTSPNFGGGLSKLYQVTSQSQLSRPITLRHYTSWSSDSAGNNNLCDVTAAADQLAWKHFCVDTYLSWVPCWLGEQAGDARTGDTINDDPILKCSPDMILCRYHVLITWFWIRLYRQLWKYTSRAFLYGKGTTHKPNTLHRQYCLSLTAIRNHRISSRHRRHQSHKI